MLTVCVSGWVQNYDFRSSPPIHVDAGDMLRRHGISPVATWDRELHGNTAYSPEGSPLAAVQYATKIKVAGETRNITLRVGYTAYVELKERFSAPLEKLRDAVAGAFEKRLARRDYLPRDGEVVELSVAEVLEKAST